MSRYSHDVTATDLVEVLDALMERETSLSYYSSACDHCRGLGVSTCPAHVWIMTERDVAKTKIKEALRRAQQV